MVEITEAALRDLADLLDDDSQSLDRFRRDLRPIADLHGWDWMGDGKVFNEKARRLFVAAYQLRYAQGRRTQLIEDSWLLWVLTTDNDERAAFNGLTLPPDHPFWARHSPPLGWEDGSYISGARSESGAERLGGEPSKQLPAGWDEIDPQTGSPPDVEPIWGTPDGPSLTVILSEIAVWRGTPATNLRPT